jgi:hypothetical protein
MAGVTDPIAVGVASAIEMFPSCGKYPARGKPDPQSWPGWPVKFGVQNRSEMVSFRRFLGPRREDDRSLFFPRGKELR